MVIHIKDPVADQHLRALAEARGISLTEALVVAVKVAAEKGGDALPKLPGPAPVPKKVPSAASRSMTPIDPTMGGRLKHARVLAGVNQAQLGKRIGVSFQQVQKYENGQNRIPVTRLRAIAETVNVSVHYLLEGLSHQPSDDVALTTEEAEVLRALRSIPNGASRRAVIRQIIELARSFEPSRRSAR